MASSNEHMTTAVSTVYAQALFDLAEQAGALDEVNDELEQIDELLTANPDLMLLLSSRMISAPERQGIIERIFGGRVSDTVLNFLRVVNQKNRLDALPAIIHEFGNLLDRRHGVVEVDAYVASRLDEQLAKRVADGIGTALKRNVLLHQYVDPELIGGLKIRIGDRMIDGSVATQLKLMKEQLMAVGREKARAAAASA